MSWRPVPMGMYTLPNDTIRQTWWQRPKQQQGHVGWQGAAKDETHED
jgi:hypothetical protein